MQYYSTRGDKLKITAAEAIIRGLAPDGGLFVPAESYISLDIEELPAHDYPELAGIVFKPFLSGYNETEITHALRKAYCSGTFDHPLVTPLHMLAKNLYILELWHGPTSAFKDIALQILPHLLRTALDNIGFKDELVILTATSGDTGKSALEGFRDIPGIRVVVYYPENGVSEIQKLQMVTQEGNNLSVAAVKGNFDDTQRGVKELFSDNSLGSHLAAHGFQLTSANSINWGRLLPQVVYYFQAYLSLVSKNQIQAGDSVNFVVPTGNFGNILAGYYARRLGLPVNKLICASNQNNILSDFIQTGRYDSNRRLSLTISPSMDILISSNLERLLFELNNHDSEIINFWMNQLREKGFYTVDKQTHELLGHLFYAGYADDEKTLATINSVYRNYNYLIDTHTAVGKAVLDYYTSNTGDNRPSIILSTASPFKFAGSVMNAINGPGSVKQKSELEILNELVELTGTNAPDNLNTLNKKEVKYKQVIARTALRDHLLSILALN